MRFPARGAWNAKFHPSYMNIGWTYVQTTLSEPEFLDCIDKQIFVPMMLRYNANCYRAGNFFLTARTWHQTNETVSPERAHSKIYVVRGKEYTVTRECWPGARSIQPKFPEIAVQKSMDRFGPTGKVSKKLVHLLRRTTFPVRTDLNFGWMDRAPALQRGLMNFQL